jgi:hypothetical protein
MEPAQVAHHIQKALEGLSVLQQTAPQHENPLYNPRRHLAVAITELENSQARLAAARTYSAAIVNEAKGPLVAVPDQGEAIEILNPKLPR